MRNSNDALITKDLVLIGGGHSHAIALKMLSMQPLAGVRITLISDAYLTPYSGMLPGFIAGHYSYEEVHIDLARLCRALGVRFIEDAVVGLDLNAQTIKCANHPDFRYDVLSIDIGSSPDTSNIPGAKEFTQGVKPVDSFLNYWTFLQTRILEQSIGDQKLHIALVGAGASGVEVALAMQNALQVKLKVVKRSADIQFHIVSATPDILPSHNQKVRDRYQVVLDKRKVKLHMGFRVSRLEKGCLFDDSDSAEPKHLKADEVIWAISASAPGWPKAAGLQCSEKGFIQVNACLQSLSHPTVFATGDIADVINHPRPKAGVFAVRQGKPLAVNLLRALQGTTLKAFKPQTRFLSLVSTGDKYAVASRGNWALSGKWVWRWKDAIDQKFMRSLNELGFKQSSAGHKDRKSEELMAMRCGGCGAKVGQRILQRVLQQIALSHSESFLPKAEMSLSGPDDAAVFFVPENKLLVQSVDAFRRFIDDDYLFGQISANHALGDIFAMGAEPHSAQAIVTLPFASEEKVEQQLLHLMLGVSKIFDAANIPIIGGHTAEGSELSLGFVVNGLVEKDRLLTKGGLQAGDVLILSKSLGTGALFAADMRGQAKGIWVKSAIESMLHSNQRASEILFSHGVKACTDVTGFGLAGHLLEMLQPSQCRAKLDLNSLPLLEGVIELMQKGFFSSLHEQNKQIEQKMSAYIELSSEDNQSVLKEILYDPQTAGGLLAGIPARNALACLQELKALGYQNACIIGEVLGKQFGT
jgi:selenide,water dikinase